MSDPLLYKEYYRPRVLIDVDHVLDAQNPGMIALCLTGGQANILRQLLAYCHRKTTFSVTYGTSGYIVPNAEQWDSVQEVVADLEGKLMADCDDLIDALDAIKASLDAQTVQLTAIVGELDGVTENQTLSVAQLTAIVGELDGITENQTLSIAQLTAIAGELDGMTEALECICSQLPWLRDDPATQAIIDEGIGDESLIVDDPYPTEAAPATEAEYCAVAQLTWYAAYEMLTEKIQPVQKYAVATLMPLAMGVIASWIGTPVLGIPVGTFVAWCWDLIEIWVDGSLEGVINSYFNNKEELICAIWTAFDDGGDVGAASAAAIDVIDAIPDLSPVDKLVAGGLFAPWVISRMAVAWTNQTAWAVSRVTPGYCSICQTPDTDFYYQFPPCPGDWHGSGYCYLDHYGTNMYRPLYGPQENLLAAAGGNYNRLRVTAHFYSEYNAGWTVGEVRYQYWDGDSWEFGSNAISMTTSVVAGNENYQQATAVIDEAGGRPIRLYAIGADGLEHINPGPLMFADVRGEFIRI